MKKLTLTETLRNEYLTLYNSLIIKDSVKGEVQAIVSKLNSNQMKYEAAVLGTNLPWQFVAVIHYLEGGGDFTKQILNGQDYRMITSIVPRGLGPWKSWEHSTREAIKYAHWSNLEASWDIPTMLYQAELHNGTGYRNKGIFSPYLWSFSQHYISGKYIKDGKFSNTAISKQIGAAVLLSELLGKQEYHKEHRGPILRYANSEVPYAKQLQTFLNSLGGKQIIVDGWPGMKTSDKFLEVTGNLLYGDPRVQ